MEAKEQEEKLIRKDVPIKDPRADNLPYGEGRQDAAIFNGVHRPEGDGRPSVDTGHRLHASVIAAKSEELKNEPVAAPATSQAALAQDLEAAKLSTVPAVKDPVEVPKKDFPSAGSASADLTKPAPAGADAKSKGPEHSKK